jgi:hypothetical protein
LPTDANLLVAVVPASNPKYGPHPLAGPERKLIEGSCSIEPGRSWLELDTRESLYPVKAEVPQDDG